LAGDDLLQSALIASALKTASRSSRQRDHHTGGDVGCHENYLDATASAIYAGVLGTLLTLFYTRQICLPGQGALGSRTIGRSISSRATRGQVNYQLSQRADHIRQ